MVSFLLFILWTEKGGKRGQEKKQTLIKSEPEKLPKHLRLEIIDYFAELLANDAPQFWEVRDVSELAYQKEDIVAAFLSEMSVVRNSKMKELMATSLKAVSHYQAGVGDSRINGVPSSVANTETPTLDNKEAQERYKAFADKIYQESRQLQALCNKYCRRK
jgi:hypothetical protein